MNSPFLLHWMEWKQLAMSFHLMVLFRASVDDLIELVLYHLLMLPRWMKGQVDDWPPKKVMEYHWLK